MRALAPAATSSCHSSAPMCPSVHAAVAHAVRKVATATSVRPYFETKLMANLFDMSGAMCRVRGNHPIRRTPGGDGSPDGPPSDVRTEDCGEHTQYGEDSLPDRPP